MRLETLHPALVRSLCRSICQKILDGHMNQEGVDSEIQKISSILIEASVELLQSVANTFLPSAVRFHYQFNLRELSNITQACSSIC